MWHLRAGGAGQVVPPCAAGAAGDATSTPSGRSSGTPFKLGLPRITWYQATRHTFASQRVLGGGTIEQLREILGHSTVLVTERYAHLRPDSFGPRERARVDVDLSSPRGKVLAMPTSPTVESGAIWVQTSDAATEKAG
jgi:hypothetical protein